MKSGRAARVGRHFNIYALPVMLGAAEKTLAQAEDAMLPRSVRALHPDAKDRHFDIKKAPGPSPAGSAGRGVPGDYEKNVAPRPARVKGAA